MATISIEERGARRRSLGTNRTGRQTKFQEVCGRLSDLAHELGPDAKLPTVLQLRDRLGVSIATLNSVLTELESQRVVRRRHGVGIYVAPDIRRHHVALLCDPSFFRASGASPFWSLLIEQVRRRAEAAHEAFSLHFATDVIANERAMMRADGIDSVTPYLPQNIVEDLRTGRIDAVLGVGLPMITADWIERQNIVYVAFAGPGEHGFGLDGDEIIRQGVAHLCEQNCKRIGFWTPVAPHRYVTPEPESQTVALFAETLAAHGRVFDADLVWDNRDLIPVGGGTHSLSHQEQGYHACMEAFGNHTSRTDWPDGIVVTDDMMAQGLLTGLQRLNVRVGEDVQIATHTNVGSPALLGWEDKITRMEVDPAELVGHMFDAVEALLHDKPVAPGTTTVKPRLKPMGLFE